LRQQVRRRTAQLVYELCVELAQSLAGVQLGELHAEIQIQISSPENDAGRATQGLQVKQLVEWQ
jgi:hypothetical protein